MSSFGSFDELGGWHASHRREQDLEEFQAMKQFLYTLLSLAVGLLSIGSAAANDVPKAVIPDYVESVLKWFPADTETLIVASHCEDKIREERTRFLRGLARQPIIKSLDDLIGQRHVLWAVHGGRTFDVISAFGTVRQEGVSVIRLAKPLSQEEMQAIVRTLRQQATKTLRIANHEVFEFPPLKQDAKQKPWESNQVILLDDSTIIKSSSTPYLDEFLNRMHSEVTDRALPDNLPEWKQVDPDANVWLLRHVPAQSPGRQRVALRGLVWTMDSGKLKLVYFPMEGQSVAHVARMPWVDRKTNKIPALLKPMLVFTEADDGTVTFSYRTAKPEDDKEELAKQVEAIRDSPELTSRLVVFSLFYMSSTQGIVH